MEGGLHDVPAPSLELSLKQQGFLGCWDLLRNLDALDEVVATLPDHISSGNGATGRLPTEDEYRNLNETAKATVLAIFGPTDRKACPKPRGRKGADRRMFGRYVRMLLQRQWNHFLDQTQQYPILRKQILQSPEEDHLTIWNIGIKAFRRALKNQGLGGLRDIISCLLVASVLCLARAEGLSGLVDEQAVSYEE